MPVSSPTPFSKEVRDYVRGCENLLSAAVRNKAHPFSRHEFGIVNYYSKEVTTMLGVLAKLARASRPVHRSQYPTHGKVHPMAYDGPKQEQEYERKRGLGREVLEHLKRCNPKKWDKL